MKALFARSLITRINKQPSNAALSTRLALAVCATCLLAACAEQPARPTPPPAPVASATPAPAPEATPPPPQSVAAPAAPDAWSRLRASFAMDDCDLNPRANTWARRFTHNPSIFEAQLSDALPLILYVQEAAERAGVPGEFVLLPMIESGYTPAEPGRNGDPAGMWQIMPQTARAYGLGVTRGYDGRLDPVASTDAVMKMLKAFHDDLRDWRLVDMAFNTGEYRMLGLMEGRDPPASDQPVRLPVGRITTDHLGKLLAMACIIRDPARFNVQLPAAGDAAQLALVPLPKAADLASAAKLAHLPLAKLREWNPGYRGNRMPADAPHHLLMPQENADDLIAAVTSDGAGALAAADAPTHRSHRHRLARHKVRQGESLLSIAARYHLDIKILRAWNGLAANADVRPGMTLLLSAPE